MADTKLTLFVPGEIDGDPLDVEKKILSDLNTLLDEVASYLDEAVKQLANAERSRIVRADKKIDPLQLQETYDTSDRADALARMTTAAKQMCAAGSELEV